MSSLETRGSIAPRSEQELIFRRSKASGNSSNSLMRQDLQRGKASCSAITLVVEQYFVSAEFTESEDLFESFYSFCKSKKIKGT
jgi:hypothetical protein